MTYSTRSPRLGSSESSVWQEHSHTQDRPRNVATKLAVSSVLSGQQCHLVSTLATLLLQRAARVKAVHLSTPKQDAHSSLTFCLIASCSDAQLDLYLIYYMYFKWTLEAYMFPCM